MNKIGTLVLLAGLSGCSEQHSIFWEFEDPQGIDDATEVYAATIYENACLPNNPVRFFGLIGAQSYSMIPPLEPGTYCFEVAVFHRTTCEATRASRAQVVLDSTQRDDLLVYEDFEAVTLGCTGTGAVCADGVGCLRCAEGEGLCTLAQGTPPALVNQYCCDPVGFCTDPELFDSSCRRIR